MLLHSASFTSFDFNVLLNVEINKGWCEEINFQVPSICVLHSWVVYPNSNNQMGPYYLYTHLHSRCY